MRPYLPAFLILALFATWAYAETISGRARVSDGDTLRIDGARVRIWGIDAPESRQACEGRDGRTYQCGRDATAVMREIIRGDDVTCERRDTDRFELPARWRREHRRGS